MQKKSKNAKVGIIEVMVGTMILAGILGTVSVLIDSMNDGPTTVSNSSPQNLETTE